eukprot:EG_transcript_11253
MSDHLKPATRFVHAGSHPDPSTGAIMTPIFQSSTFVQEAPAVNKGYDYSRAGNPTRSALEEALASIEGGKFGLAFGSGIAATDAILKLLKQGDEVIAASDMYGGTYRLFSKIFSKFGLTFHYVDMTDLSQVEAKVNPNTRLIWTETPTNPLMNISDIRAIADVAHRHGLLLCVDNTFASPALQNPLALGADIVMHSATKYLGGHSDVVLGAVVVNDPQLREDLHFIQKSSGAIPGPMDCFLVLRGIKTLGVRMERHSKNGAAVAHFLRGHPAVKKVFWPGFEDHPGHAVARRQMKDFGGMISFELRDDSVERTMALLSGTKVFTLAESLGGVESLINHPATMTHASIPREERVRNGLSDMLIRLSVGIEDPDDLVADLESAIQQATSG